MDSGLEVLVQDVMAAMTMEPCLSSNSWPFFVNFLVVASLFSATPKPLKPTALGRHLVKSFLTSLRTILSCGLLGPEIQGST